MLRYDLQDAERWGAFSGDFNPIHFDREQAARLGSDELSVHGMRAMLDLKHFLSSAIQPSSGLEDAQYLTFSARLRQPLWCNQDYLMSLQPSKRAQRISAIMADTAGETCFDARIDAATTLQLEESERSDTFTNERWSELSNLFPRPAESFAQWIFLDAVLFQCLVREPETFASIKASFPGLQGDSLGDIFARLAVIQTHHETRFHHTLLAGHSDTSPAQAVHYAIQQPLISGDMQHGAVLRIAAQAWRAEQPLMTTALTLKAWAPTQANN